MKNNTTNGTVKFKKVSFEQFEKDWIKTFPEDENNYEYIKNTYDNIKLPEQTTSKFAEYNFFIPMDAEFYTGGSMLIPTGIACTDMPDNEVLVIYSHDSLGCKYTQNSNILAIIKQKDNTDNEEHIFINITNNNDEDISFEAGNILCQGILLLPGKAIIDDEYCA